MVIIFLFLILKFLFFDVFKIELIIILIKLFFCFIIGVLIFFEIVLINLFII